MNKMALYINNLETIKQFLQQRDKALVAQVHDDILGANQLWGTLKGGDKIYYLFANFHTEPERSEVVKFWITNIREYNYLFVYAMLFWWAEQWEDDEELKIRLESFQKRFCKNIEEEIIKFNEEDNGVVPVIIFREMKFIIDAYQWKSKKIVPSNAMELLKEDSSNYDRYLKLLKTSIEGINYTSLIQLLSRLLDFCKATDQIAGNNKCFKELLANLSDMKRCGQISDMLVNVVTGNRNEYDYESLIALFIYYCQITNNFTCLSHDEQMSIIVFKRNLFKIRVNDYLNNYCKFIKLKNFFNVRQPSWMCNSFYSDNTSFGKWLSFAKAWNYLRYYKETNLYSFEHLKTSLSNEIYNELESFFSKVVDVFINNNMNESNAKKFLVDDVIKKIIALFLEDVMELYKELKYFKKSVIEECICSALRDCCLHVPQPEVIVVLDEMSIESNSVIQISISYFDKEKEVLSFCESSKNIEPLHMLENLIPHKFIDEFTIAYKSFFGGWKKSIPESKKEKYLKEFHLFIDECYDFVLETIMYYLDYDYMSFMNLKKRKKDTSEFTYCCSSNSSNNPCYENGYRELKDWLIDQGVNLL